MLRARTTVHFVQVADRWYIYIGILHIVILRYAILVSITVTLSALCASIFMRRNIGIVLLSLAELLSICMSYGIHYFAIVSVYSEMNALQKAPVGFVVGRIFASVVVAIILSPFTILIYFVLRRIIKQPLLPFSSLRMFGIHLLILFVASLVHVIQDLVYLYSDDAMLRYLEEAGGL